MAYTISDLYGISSSSSQVTLLSALTVPVRWPKGFFRPYSQMIPLGDGTIRGAGWPTATWSWNSITQQERDQLRTFCPGASASGIWIKTRTMDSADSYATYRCVMVWPIESEERDAGVRQSFQIEFRKLVAV